MTLAEATSCITSAFRNGRMSHSYLVAGDTDGDGAALAEGILQMLACERDHSACGECVPCRQVRDRLWMDAAWIYPEKKSRVISAEQMREQVLPRIAQTSLAGGWKSVVLVAADRLNESAANVFLKTLEEPPPQTLFLLLTDAPQSLMPTIVSRCQRIDLARKNRLGEPWRSRLTAILSTDTIDGPLGGMAAGGAIGMLLKEAKNTAAEAVEAAQKEQNKISLDDSVVDALTSARYRELRSQILRGVQDWYRDILVLRAASGADVPLNYPECAELLKTRAGRMTRAQAMASVQGVEEMHRQLERSLSEDGVLAYWMDRVRSGV